MSRVAFYVYYVYIIIELLVEGVHGCLKHQTVFIKWAVTQSVNLKKMYERLI